MQEYGLSFRDRQGGAPGLAGQLSTASTSRVFASSTSKWKSPSMLVPGVTFTSREPSAPGRQGVICLVAGCQATALAPYTAVPRSAVKELTSSA